MQKFIAILTLFAAALSGQAATKKITKKPAAKAPAPQEIVPLTIPKGAVRNADGNWDYTDKQGKRWIYSSSPFGIGRTPYQEKPSADAGGASQLAPPTTFVDNGDTVKFERASPFGTMKWEKKKTELNDEERRIMEAQSTKPR